MGSVSKDALNKLRSTLPYTLNTNSDKYQEIRSSFKSWSKVSGNNSTTTLGSVSRGSLDGLATTIRNFANEILELIDEIPVYSITDNPNKVYIPTLRGLRPLDDAHRDFYLEKTKQDYFSHQTSEDSALLEKIEAKRPEIFTGLSLYKRLTDLLLGNNSERKLIADYQNFISRKLFEDKSVALIPNQTEKVVIVKIGDEKEQPIHHLGDGIQSAIILTFLPFVMQEQTFFFIEEPEMFLHPGLQRKILNFYNSLEQHTFFLTTSVKQHPFVNFFVK